jgi:uncharacterized protein DUF6191
MELFQPSLRHAREERERLELTVDHPESGAPPLGIDLDGGTARFVMPLRAAEPVPLLQEVEQDQRGGNDDRGHAEHED